MKGEGELSDGDCIYLDHNATTPLASSVVEEISVSLSTQWGNPSSVHEPGRRAKESITKARQQLATLIGASLQEIIFMSGGTEANNTVIYNAVEHFHSAASFVNTGKKPHIITSNVEHDSVVLPIKHLQKKGLIDVTVVPVGPNGCLTIEDVAAEIRYNTCLVTIMMANNETGVIMPVAEIGQTLHTLNKHRAKSGLGTVLFHSDAAQAIGKVPVDVEVLQVDYLTVVGHKFYGPRVGCLYARCGQLNPLLHGGGQERGLRPGTENTPMLVGLGEAASLVHRHLALYSSHMSAVRDHLETRLEQVFGPRRVVFNCRNSFRLPNTCSMALLCGLTGAQMLACCRRIVASTGAACHQHGKPSEILLASHVPEAVAMATIRLSVGRDTTIEDVEAAVDDLHRAVMAKEQGDSHPFIL